MQAKTILDGESLSVLPVRAEGARNFFDVHGPASNVEVSKSMHFLIVNEGLLESFLAVWCYAGMMDSNIQWKVRPGQGLNQESVSGTTISLPGW